jgi:gliding motility-associated-like protein
MRRSLLQTSHGDIIVGDAVFKLDRTDPDSLIKESHLHFLSLDYNTGVLKWETDYRYALPGKPFIANQVKIFEQAGGKLLFFTSLPVIDGNGVEKIKACRIRTDATGHIETIDTYHQPTSTQSSLIEVCKSFSTGELIFLFNHDGLPQITGINNSGVVSWKQGYSNEGGKFPPSCFTSHAKGFALLTGDGRSWQSKLLLSVNNGTNCLNQPIELVQETAILNYGAHMVTVQNPSFNEPFEFAPLTLNQVPYSRQQTILCEEQVNSCHDIVDSINIKKIKICEGELFTLPDQQKIRDSGRYYVRIPSSSGCDSIHFYNLTVEQHPNKLTLGRDTCIKDQTPVKLTATPAYSSYTWMNNAVSESNEKIIYAPGSYWVNTTNICGAKTDTIQVFDRCDFDIQMPTGFTPNGDQLNDLFRVPLLNHNRFISLTIYNRWGQVLFQTKDQSKGWNGSFRSQPQTTGIYIYELEMQGLSGKRLQQRGTFILLK